MQFTEKSFSVWILFRTVTFTEEKDGFHGKYCKVNEKHSSELDGMHKMHKLGLKRGIELVKIYIEGVKVEAANANYVNTSFHL